jgi:hypothetical protein
MERGIGKGIEEKRGDEKPRRKKRIGEGGGK